MTPAWVLIADSSRARLFSVDKALAPLQEIGRFSHPESRVRAQDLTTDRAARRGTFGAVPAASVEPKRQQAVTFAKELSEHLKQGRISGQYSKLYIAAAPAFLGLLRDKLDSSTANLLAGSWDKDLTQMENADIRRHLPERL